MAEFSRAIQKQDTIVTISDTSRIVGGTRGDTVNIDTVINLTTSEPQEITLVLPTITGDPDKAYLRTLNEVENRQEFQSPVDLEQLDTLPDELRLQLQKKIEILNQEWHKTKEEAGLVVASTVKLEAGSQELKFFLQKEISPTQTTEGEIFELSFIAPQSNFRVNEGMFTMTVIIILPRGASLYGEPSAISPDGIPTPILEYNGITPNINRHILQYSMQYDPIFTIRYKY